MHPVHKQDFCFRYATQSREFKGQTFLASFVYAPNRDISCGRPNYLH